MVAKTDVRMSNPGSVIPGCNCQKPNRVGAHWFRSSFDHKDLNEVAAFVSTFYGDYELEDRCALNYTTRFIWPSGVSLNFDEDPERRKRLHRERITLDVPGKACDELTANDLLTLMEGCKELGCKCTRLDVYFDDYNRFVEMNDLRLAAAKGDFSVFRISSENRSRDRTHKENDGIIYDALTFGRRGSKGSGAFLRIYDKNIESKGESDCIRLEIEFTQHKAQEVFKVLAGVDGNLEAFAVLCGALIGGCITFVHRIPGRKHIDRLDEYEWWKLIKESLGTLSLRVAKKQNTLTGMIEWQEKQVMPSLACVRKAFESVQSFFNWLSESLDKGESRMNFNQVRIAKQNAGSLVYNRKFNREKQRSDYLNAMCVQVS